MKQQQGIVLIVVLILILPITLIAVSVMQWAREGSKGVAATGARVRTEQAVMSTLMNLPNVANLSSTILKMPNDNYTTAVTVTTATGGEAKLWLRSPESTCKSSSTSNSSFATTCRVVNASAENTAYGKQGMGRLSYVMGVEQPMLNP